MRETMDILFSSLTARLLSPHRRRTSPPFRADDFRVFAAAKERRAQTPMEMKARVGMWLAATGGA